MSIQKRSLIGNMTAAKKAIIVTNPVTKANVARLGVTAKVTKPSPVAKVTKPSPVAKVTKPSPVAKVTKAADFAKASPHRR